MNAIIPADLSLAKPWKPRASSAGYYMKCLWRACCDRMIDEGKMPASIKAVQEDTYYADLGTCIHFELQDGIRCLFPGPSKDHAPTEAEWISASWHFGNDMARTRAQVRASAQVAASALPPSPDRQPWFSEDELENELVTGHTDFLSQDETMIGDLKTTAKPPVNGRAKYEHLVQMVCYKLLVPTAQRGFILYVDSQRAAWTTLVWIDFNTPGMLFFTEKVAEFLAFLCTDMLPIVAFPNLGDHCSSTWCGYNGGCHNMIVPPRGIDYNVAIARRPTGPMKLTQIAALPLAPAAPVNLGFAPAPPT